MMDENYSFFFELDLEDYLGEWIAIQKGKLVARGKSAKQVYDKAKKKFPDKRPLVTKVPERKATIF